MRSLATIILTTLLASMNIQAMDKAPARMIGEKSDAEVSEKIRTEIMRCFSFKSMDSIIGCLIGGQDRLREEAKEIKSSTLKNNLSHELKEAIRIAELMKSMSRHHRNPREVINDILDDIFLSPEISEVKSTGKEIEESEEKGKEIKESEEKGKSPEELDKDYFSYIAPQFGVKSEDLFSRKIDPMTLLDNFKTEGKLNTTDLTIPPGKYAMPIPYIATFWQQNATRSELESVNPRGQGWKIHISALPHSAKKIASLILPEINNLPHQKGPRVFYKIIGSLPLMRTMWYVYGKVKGQESQVGKFLVIYPDNGAHAYELVKKIDNILVSAKKRGLLKDSDFIPLLGDAQVGHSGWVYVRYGGLTVHRVKKLDPMEATMQLGEESSIELFQDDDRFHPWPDFMNKGNMFWKSQPNPFHDLPLKWTPINQRKVITWENRPNSWFELDNTEDELSDLKESFAVFDKKFQEEAIRQQIESDRLLAEKIHLEEVAKYEEEQKQIREDEEFARKLQQEELKRGA